MSSNTSTDEFRVGIIGTGFLGMAMSREFSRHGRGEVAAITDVNPDNLESAAEELGLFEESLYEDYEEMLAAETLDGLVVTTPHALHYEQITAGLDHDLHVLCEKPMCTDLSDAKALFERVESSDRTVMLGYQRHLDQAFQAARRYWQDSDERPTFINAHVTQDWINAVEGSWKANPDLSGGGQLYDTGSHIVDSILWITDLEPESVTAQMEFHDDAKRVDTQAGLTVHFENGAVGTIAVSGDTPRVNESLQIWGDDGATVIDGREWNPREYTEIDIHGDINDPNGNWGSEMPKADAFIKATENGTEPPATVRDGLRATAVTEAAYEAAWSGKRVNIDLEY